ncbi:MAG: mitochondrial fission ELM1 family protein [Candidatus Omnitrophota bacterium]|nr:MAG: mitochondrial fission ELM1 family protein [Candidatus Omnitrophota bacterium]
MYRCAKFLRAILMHLPLGVSLVFGKMIGFILYYNGKKRRTAFKNIKLAFPDLSNKELHRILRKSFKNFGLSVVESLIAPRIFQYVTLERQSDNAQKGEILVGIHSGSWELYNCFLANQFPYAIFAQEQRKKNLDVFLNELRLKRNLGVCFSLKEVVRHLRANFAIGLVADHGAEKDAYLVEFFSHLVPTPKGAPYLAKKFHKKIYPCFGHRKKNFSHTLTIGSPIDVQGLSDEAVLRNLNVFYEDKLRTYPQEYLWYYKRFKRKRDLHIVVLSDGKIGHLKQSQALLAFFSKTNYQVKSKTIEVRYRHKVTKVFSEVCAALTGKGCLGCGKCLRVLVQRDTHRALEASYADIVISTGSYVAPINRVFASSIGAKAVVILRPNIPFQKFDLVILPEHDRTLAPNVVNIKGALFYPRSLEDKVKACRDFFGLSAERKISVFLGGTFSDEKEFQESTKAFISKLKEFSLKSNYKILMSTSRRTSPHIERLIEQTLEGFKNCEAIVYANRANYNFVFDGFVSLSDMVFISSESISMISEVLSLKKPCVCVSLERLDGKYNVFLDSIKNDVSILRRPYDIDLIEPKESGMFDENKKRVTKAIQALL